MIEKSLDFLCDFFHKPKYFSLKLSIICRNRWESIRVNKKLCVLAAVWSTNELLLRNRHGCHKLREEGMGGKNKSIGVLAPGFLPGRIRSI